jgi:hypothetical protein
MTKKALMTMTSALLNRTTQTTSLATLTPLFLADSALLQAPQMMTWMRSTQSQYAPPEPSSYSLAPRFLASVPGPKNQV